MYKDDGVEKLSEKTGDVAFVIQSLSKKKKKHDVNELYTKVMKIEGFEEITRSLLVMFLIIWSKMKCWQKHLWQKNINLRKIWVQTFVNQHYYRPDC
jgi:hypothetical protein